MEFAYLPKYRPPGFHYGEESYLDPETGITYVDLNVFPINPPPPDEDDLIFLSDPWIISHEKPEGLMQLAQSSPIQAANRRERGKLFKFLFIVQVMFAVLLLWYFIPVHEDIARAVMSLFSGEPPAN